MPGVLVGDPVEIEVARGPERGRRFLGLRADAASPKAGVVIVHGIGVHPDHGVIGALRTRLHDRGYTTLAIQMPVLAADAPGEAYFPALFTLAAERIAAAARHLQGAGMPRLVLVGHSLGAWMANCYLLDRPDAPFAAFVALSIGGTRCGNALAAQPALADTRLPGPLARPVLDVLGERDFDAPRAGAAARAEILHTLPHSTQVTIAGADHFYAGREDTLAQAIDAFIARAIR